MIRLADDVKAYMQIRKQRNQRDRRNALDWALIWDPSSSEDNCGYDSVGSSRLLLLTENRTPIKLLVSI